MGDLQQNSGRPTRWHAAKPHGLPNRTPATEAGERLHSALVDLAHRGQRPPCADDPELWYADHLEQRREAAQRCAGCPLFEACDEAGADEKWGVWAGVDRTGRNRLRQPNQAGKQEDITSSRMGTTDPGWCYLQRHQGPDR
jgi:hypothetical protein